MKLCFKCKIYGRTDHKRCYGTTDDGTDSPCECWCQAVPPASPFQVPAEDTDHDHQA